MYQQKVEIAGSKIIPNVAHPATAYAKNNSL